MDSSSLSHTSWNCKYHIVFASNHKIWAERFLGPKVMCFVFTLFDDLDEFGFIAVIP